MPWTNIDWELVRENLWLHVNGYSFLTAMLFFALFGFCIHLLRSRTFLLEKSGNILFFSMVLAALRMALPLCFHFSYDIGSTHLLTALWTWYRTPISLGFTTKILHWQIVFFLWMAGVVLCILIQIRNVQKVKSFYQEAKKWKVEKPLWEMELAKLQEQRRKKAELIVSPLVKEPMAGGVFHSVIYLPPALSEENVKMVLAHEYEHILRKDSVKKIFFHLMHCLFWFHPAFVWLKKDLHQMLELQCDHAVTKSMAEEDKKRYFHAMLAQLTSQQDVQSGFLHNYFFRESDFQNVKQRLELLLKRKKEDQKIRKKVLSHALLLLLFFSTYGIVFIPDYASKTMEPGEYLMETEDLPVPKNFWLRRPDGKYVLVKNLKFVKVVKEISEYQEYPVIE